MPGVSRRDFFRIAVAVAGASGIAGAASEDQPRELVREFTDAYLRALSPDGRKICLYFTKNTTVSFRFSGSKWHDVTKRRGGDTLGVIEVDSWKELFSIPHKGVAPTASFFADSDRIITNTLLLDPRPSEHQHLLIDLRSGHVEDRTEVFGEPVLYVDGYRNDMVVGSEYSKKTHRTEAYTHIRLPTWETVLRVPAIPEGLPHSDRRYFADPMFSLDRQFFAYPVNENLLYRRSADLGLAWARVLDPSLNIWRLGVSATGDWVVAALNEPALEDKMKIWKVLVLDGRDGSTVAELPVNGIQGVAISPDGRLVAVGEQKRLPGRVEKYELWVRLFEVPSGREMARWFHDRMRKRRGIIDTDFITDGIQFTADGRYLVSSGRKTRIWQIPSKPADSK